MLNPPQVVGLVFIVRAEKAREKAGKILIFGGTEFHESHNLIQTLKTEMLKY